jgi:hypothetical protein
MGNGTRAARGRADMVAVQGRRLDSGKYTFYYFNMQEYMF